MERACRRILPVLFLGLFTLFNGCGPEEATDKVGKKERSDEAPAPRVEPPTFVADSAYRYIKKQVDFGPRVPNTNSHRKCADYLEQKLRSFGWETHVQKGEVKAYDGDRLKIRNIYARLNPDDPERVMLFAHWDTRPMADRGEVRTDEPIPGANDGGSGVGVLLEMARIMAQRPPKVGVDIFFFDAEDQGQPESTPRSAKRSDTWCLGTQYWVEHMPIPDYAPKYGVLLDMVGDSNAVFPQEGISRRSAPWLVDRIWEKAQKLGYGNRFIPDQVGAITDDHLYVHREANIPCVNIVHIDPRTDDFGSFHHTHQDNMSIISRKPLEAVGNTLLEVLYSE